MNRHLKNLLDEKAQIVASAQAALEAGEYEQAEDFKNQIAEINNKIEMTRETIAAASAAAVPADGLAPGEGAETIENDASDKVADILASTEYRNAFFNAFRGGESIKTIKNKETFAPLMNALSETGGTPPGSEGGFLLPIDFDNTIHELRRAHRSLLPYVHVENVTFFSGWRAREKNPATATLSLLAELTNLPAADEPEFEQVEYQVKKYGGFLPIASELLEDTPANIMEYVGRWFARLSVNTENAAIIALLNLLTATAFNKAQGVASIKTALNKSLDPEISINSIILTNQDGFDALDQMEDANKRPLLQPNPTSDTEYRIKGRDVVVMSNKFLPSDTTNQEAPMYIGDLTQYIQFYMRKTFEFATTDVGGNAWRTDSVEARGIERFDAQVMDKEAAVKLVIPLT